MTKTRVFYIIGAGEFINNHLKINDLDFVCACDGGYIHCLKNNIKVDILIGDFDSLDVIPNNVKIIKLNPVKDETDIYAALNYGINLGYTKFKIYGATGKRDEHTFANIQILHNLKTKNIEAQIINDNKIYEVLHNQTKEFGKENSGYFSMFSLSNTSLVTLKNFKYNVEKYILKNDFPLGIDNEFINKEASISVDDGYVLIVYYIKNI